MGYKKNQTSVNHSEMTDAEIALKKWNNLGKDK